VGRLCRVLGVSRSGYYGARQRSRAAPTACLASTQLKAEFAASGRVYGSRRLCAVLCAKGLRLGRHRVRRLMREHRLRALWRRRFIHTTDSGHALPVSDNLLARRFDPNGPNQAWVSDITYIRTRSVCVRQTHLDGCTPGHGADSQPLTPRMGMGLQRRRGFSSATSGAAATRRSGWPGESASDPARP
jgi:hypothetical protein